MASSKDRERKLARAKIERQQARRAEQTRRRRATQARIAAGVSLLLVFVVVSWSLDWYGLFKNPKAVDASGCAWNTVGVENSATTKTGTPPLLKTKIAGARDMTINTSEGTIDAQLDATSAPCSTESFTFLSARHFFDNTKCHRLTTDTIYILQCGDPSGTGTGGPSYQYPDENLPVDFAPAPGSAPSGGPSSSPGASSPPSAAPSSNAVIYPAGTIAMANSGPDTNGSQFFIVYKDSPFTPDYSVVGKVTKGLDVLTKIAKGGVQDVNGTAQADGKPNIDVTIQSLTIADPASNPPGSPSPEAPSPTSLAPTPSGSASSKS